MQSEDDHEDDRHNNQIDDPSPSMNPTCLDDGDEEKDSFVSGERHDDGKIYLREIRPDGNLFVGKDGVEYRELTHRFIYEYRSIHFEFTNTRSDEETRRKENDQLHPNLDEEEVTYTNDLKDDTLLVTNKQIADPCGAKGVYTGALSKSTGIPNGKGRLEYEKEGRWYDEDWILGRWTGYGRVSNGVDDSRVSHDSSCCSNQEKDRSDFVMTMFVTVKKVRRR